MSSNDKSPSKRTSNNSAETSKEIFRSGKYSSTIIMQDFFRDRNKNKK